MSLNLSEKSSRIDGKLELRNQLIFKNVYYSYPEKFALKDINFNIPAFSKIGIVGTTGGGKTTLIDLC